VLNSLSIAAYSLDQTQIESRTNLLYISRNAYPVDFNVVPYVSAQGALVYGTSNVSTGLVVYNAFNGQFAYIYPRYNKAIPTQVAGNQLLLVSSTAGGMFLVALDLVSGEPTWTQSFPASSSSYLGIVGFSATTGPNNTAVVTFAQETAIVQTVMTPLAGASPVFPGGAGPANSPAGADGSKSKTWIIAVAVGALVIIILVVVVVKKKSSGQQADTDYVPMNPAVQV
jgi:hypothetical protein